MDLPEFLAQLAEEGVAVVGHDETVGGSVQSVVRDWDLIQRRNLAGDAPDLDLAAAEWAAVRLYRACQALVCREMPQPEMEKMLREPCPAPASPAVDYSVDLVFRFLPQVATLARRVAQSDPLVEELRALGRAWPLSSVGMENLGQVDAARILAHLSLRQLYIDRILLSSDASRLHDPEIRAAANAALGAHPELAPDLHPALHPSS